MEQDLQKLENVTTEIVQVLEEQQFVINDTQQWLLFMWYAMVVMIIIIIILISLLNKMNIHIEERINEYDLKQPLLAPDSDEV